MLRIFAILLILVTLIGSFSFFPKHSLAQTSTLPFCESSAVETNPTPLYSDTSNPNFTIDVGSFMTPGSQWKMEWLCSFAGKGQTQKDATVIAGTNKITATLDGNPWLINACELDPKNNPISIKVKKITTNGDLDICVSRYNATDRPCSLDINPKDNIVVGTPITVDITNLTNKGRFLLFVDNYAVGIDRPSDIIWNPVKGNLQTPQDLGFKIPQSFLTPGPHTISVRPRRDPTDVQGIFQSLFGGIEARLNESGAMAQFAKDPICSQTLTVGSVGHPGNVGPGAAQVRACKQPDDPAFDPNKDTPCVTSSGQSCGSVSSPAFKTAIGCIHTNPIEFVKDLLKFITAIAGGAAFLMMLMAAFQMLTSQGNPQTLKSGQETFTNALIGLLFIIFAILLLQIIGFNFLALPGFKNF